ncbi:MAG: hypothetical protein KAY37_05850 [Phycisphaerae bacterium]|nr:hypothetical protein [Phycisphaerae bacterium]
MNPPENITERARERADHLFEGRRDRAGLSTDHPEWYTQCEAGEAQPFPGGWQVRVRTWRHWSDATVHFEADTGEVMHRCVDRLSDPPTEDEMMQEEALSVAEGLFDIPPGAELSSFRHEDFAAGGRKVARLDWIHVHQGLRVDGDYFWVMIHPDTERVVAFGHKWRKIGTE